VHVNRLRWLNVSVFFVTTLSGASLWAHDLSEYIDANRAASESHFRKLKFFDESPRRLLKNLEEGPYLAVNRIICIPDSPNTGATIEQAVGTLVDSETTVITVAHIFAGEDLHWRRASNCGLVIYKYEEIIDRIPIQSYKTSWTGPHSSQEHPDIAIAHLSRPPKWWIDPMNIEASTKVESVFFVTIGVLSGDRRVVSQGIVCPHGKISARNDSLIMKTSISGQQGDSGSPILDSSTGKIIAVYVGDFSIASQRDSNHFDCQSNYSRGAVITPAIVGEIEWGF
jgi:hypothetical protein